jgi:hypothetical protein
MEQKHPEIPEYLKKIMQSGEDLDEIRIDSEGRWYCNDKPFKNKNIINFFNKSIDITKDGIFVLNYSNFVYPIIVEDTPLFVTGIRYYKSDKEESLFVALTSGEVEKLDIDTLHYKNNALYCFVRNGAIPAKFKRSPSYEILQNIKENDDIYYLDICGKRIVLTEKI